MFTYQNQPVICPNALSIPLTEYEKIPILILNFYYKILKNILIIYYIFVNQFGTWFGRPLFFMGFCHFSIFKITKSIRKILSNHCKHCTFSNSMKISTIMSKFHSILFQNLHPKSSENPIK